MLKYQDKSQPLDWCALHANCEICFLRSTQSNIFFPQICLPCQASEKDRARWCSLQFSVIPPDPAIHFLPPLLVVITFVYCRTGLHSETRPSNCVRMRIYWHTDCDNPLAGLLCSWFGGLQAHRGWTRIQYIK